MRSRDLVCAAVFCLLFVGSAATAQPPKETKPKTMGEVWSELIPDFANISSAEEARAVALKGIGSDDPEIVRETVYQIGIIAMLATMEDYGTDIPDDFREPPRRFEPLRRQFATIPGLRERLVELVRNGAEQTSQWMEPDVEYASLSDTQRRQLETWSMAGLALAAYFPLDPAVHDFLIDWWRRSEDRHGFAMLLYTGRFRSKAVDEIHIASLTGGAEDAVAAAKGLALSGSNAALAALVANLDRRDSALQTIVEAIATYGDRARPHIDSLLDLRGELEAYVVDEDDPRALNSWRKRSIVDTISSLAAELETFDDR